LIDDSKRREEKYSEVKTIGMFRFYKLLYGSYGKIIGLILIL